MVLPRSLVAAGWPGLAYKEGPEDPPEGVSKRITFEHVYTNLALENCTMIFDLEASDWLHRWINQSEVSKFRRKITLNSKKFDLVYQFFFQKSLKLLSQSPQNNKFYFPNFNYTLPPSHPIQFDRNTLQNVYSSLNFILTLFGRTQRLEVLR